MSPPKPTARVAKDGYLQVQIANPPGCMARAETWLKRAAGYALAAGLGFLAGVVWRGWG